MAVAERIALELPELHAGQEEIKASAARFNVVACGRRYGKTLLGEDLAAETALAGQPVAWFSPTYKMLAEVWRDLKQLLHPVARRVNEQEHRLELITGGTIECWSLDSPDTVRGRKYKRVIVDEAAMVGGLLETWRRAIRPTLTDLIGDAWFLSTPKGLNGFWVLYQQGEDPQSPEWRSWSMPTTANPYISAQEVEAARGDEPERDFAQEYLAQFLTDGAGVFRRVREAATATRQDMGLRDHRYVFGVDWGQLHDFTVVSVLDVTTRQQVYLDRFNQVDWYLQVGRIRVLAEKFRPALVIAERNSVGSPQIEAMTKLNLPVWGWDASNATKHEAMTALSLAFERGDIKILPDPVQVGELLAYDAERLPSGVLRYGAPEGMHDDTVIALALSWLGARAPDGRPTQREFRVEA